MGWLSVVICALAAYTQYKLDHTALMILAIIAAVGSFWSWGIMHNYAVEAARRRLSYTGRFYDFTEGEVESVPNWITLINMIFSLGGLVLLIVGVIMIPVR